MPVKELLRNKYGIGHLPTDVEICRWVEETDKLLRVGVHEEAAGAKAAEIIFTDMDLEMIDPEAEPLSIILEKTRQGRCNHPSATH